MIRRFARTAACAACAALASIGTAIAQSTTPQDAVKSAKTMPLPDPRTFMTPGNAAQVPGASGDTSLQRGQFGGGKGNPTPAGADRVAECLAKKDPECLAVQLVATGKAGRPQFTITKDDPLVRFGDQVRAQPGTPPPNGDQSCTTSVVQHPGGARTETCAIVQLEENNTCSVIRRVDVDADANYRCATERGRTNTGVCGKTLDVTVVVGEPTCVGTWVRTLPWETTNASWTFSYRCGPIWNRRTCTSTTTLYIEGQYKCELDRTDGMLVVRIGGSRDRQPNDLVEREIQIHPGTRTLTRLTEHARPIIYDGGEGGPVVQHYEWTDIFYWSGDNPPDAAWWELQLVAVVRHTADTDADADIPSNITLQGAHCPRGGMLGDSVWVRYLMSNDTSVWEEWRRGAPAQCYIADGRGTHVIRTGDWWNPTSELRDVSTYAASSTGFSVDGSKYALVKTMRFPRPTVPRIVRDSWINNCAGLEGRL